jgi:hypothetical protein
MFQREDDVRSPFSRVTSTPEASRNAFVDTSEQRLTVPCRCAKHGAKA